MKEIQSLSHTLKMLLLAAIFILLPRLTSAQPPDEVEAPLQQQNIDTEEKTKTDLGLRIGFGISTLRTSGLENPKPYFGYVIAMYHRIHLNKQKTVAFQYELAARFKGGNFANGDSGYSKLSLFYVEMPLMVSLRLNKKKKHAVNLLVGFQPGILARSTLAVGEKSKTPVYFDMPLQRFDYAPVLATQFDLGSGIGLQLACKYGIPNVSSPDFYTQGNPKYQDPVIQPPIRPGNEIRNLSFELAFVF